VINVLAPSRSGDPRERGPPEAEIVRVSDLPQELPFQDQSDQTPEGTA
jgi:hypothetical protein